MNEGRKTFEKAKKNRGVNDARNLSQKTSRQQIKRREIGNIMFQNNLKYSEYSMRLLRILALLLIQNLFLVWSTPSNASEIQIFKLNGNPDTVESGKVVDIDGTKPENHLEIPFSKIPLVSIVTAPEMQIVCVEDPQNKKDWILVNPHALLLGGPNAREAGTITLFVRRTQPPSENKITLTLTRVPENQSKYSGYYFQYKEQKNNPKHDSITCVPLIS